MICHLCTPFVTTGPHTTFKEIRALSLHVCLWLLASPLTKSWRHHWLLWFFAVAVYMHDVIIPLCLTLYSRCRMSLQALQRCSGATVFFSQWLQWHQHYCWHSRFLNAFAWTNYVVQSSEHEIPTSAAASGYRNDCTVYCAVHCLLTAYVCTYCTCTVVVTTKTARWQNFVAGPLFM